MLHGSAYFSASEFACRCKCGFGSTDIDIPQDFVYALHTLRRLLSVPFVITSAARCAKHNTAEGGAKKSAHLPGMKGQCTPSYEGQCRAVDIQTTSWSCELRGRAVVLALALGLRVGLHKDFLHFDCELRPYYNPGIWLYGTGETSGTS